MDAEQHVLEVPTAPARTLEYGLEDVLDDTNLGGHTDGRYSDTPVMNMANSLDAVPSYSIVAGSFRSLSLVLLAFSPLNSTLRCVQRIEGFGPHQYLAASSTLGGGGQIDAVFTTSWATPPILSSWRVLRGDSGRVESIEHDENVPITATSSYITIPPPHNFIYSVGGPTGEVHSFSIPDTEGASPQSLFGPKAQEVLFVPPEELDSADKTRVALRYGSHGIEFSSSGYAFVPVLGTDSIEMYRRELDTGLLVHVSTNGSPRGEGAGDGPRHVKVHPNGKVVYCVTEHTNFLDVYEIVEAPTPALKHLSSHSIIPPHSRPTSHLSSDHTDDAHRSSEDPHLKSVHRGGTLMLTPPTSLRPAPEAILTTTRGANKNVRGWVSLFRLDDEGRVVTSPAGNKEDDENYVVRYETPTSTGKANALDIKSIPSTTAQDEGGVWIILTDDDAAANDRGAVRILEWKGWASDAGKELMVIAEWPSGSTGKEEYLIGKTEGTVERDSNGAEQVFRGASHAIWLD